MKHIFLYLISLLLCISYIHTSNQKTASSGAAIKKPRPRTLAGWQRAYEVPSESPKNKAATSPTVSKLESEAKTPQRKATDSLQQPPNLSKKPSRCCFGSNNKVNPST